MYHHAESPEVIRATRDELERTVAALSAQRTAERLLAQGDREPAPGMLRSALDHVRKWLRPSRPMQRIPSD